MVRRLTLSVVLSVGVFSIVTMADVPAAEGNSSQSVASLADLAKAGVSGHFYEVYRVTGPTSGTVAVAQSAMPGHSPFVTGPGKWSFLYKATTGFSAQWIEQGPTVWSCWHWPGVESWTCGGPGHFYGSNGFALSIGPYIPGIVFNEVTQLKSKPPQITLCSRYSSSSKAFGALRCIRVEGTMFVPTSACFDRRGILVTQVGGGSSPWTTITLLRFRSSVPKSAFKLEGKVSRTDVVFPSPPL